MALFSLASTPIAAGTPPIEVVINSHLANPKDFFSFNVTVSDILYIPHNSLF